MSSLPELESKFDQVLEQFNLLTRDIEKHRWDAGVTVLVNNGTVDVRGLGTTVTPAEAQALLYMAISSLPPVDRRDLAAAGLKAMERSERIAKEAEYWRPEH